MICEKCGNNVADGMKFCPKCGSLMAQAEPVMQEMPKQPKQKPEKVKKEKGQKKFSVLSFVLGIALAAVLAAALVLTSVLKFGGGAKGGKMEGKGYDSPEAAITAYAEALKAGDLDKMISTFAVESYCDNFNSAAYMNRIKSYNSYLAANSVTGAQSDTVMGDLDIENRRKSITNQIGAQMQVLQYAQTGNQDLYDVLNGEGVNGASEDTYIQLAKDIAFVPNLSGMQIGEVIYPEQVNTLCVSSNYFKNQYSIAKCMGADGYKPLAISFTLNGYQGFITMDTVKYNGRWYNYSSTGQLAAIIGLPTLYGGMCYLIGDVSLSDIMAESAANMMGCKAEFAEVKAEYDLHRMEELQNTLDEIGVASLEELKANWDEIFSRYPTENYMFMMSMDEFMEFFALTELK